MSTVSGRRFQREGAAVVLLDRRCRRRRQFGRQAGMPDVFSAAALRVSMECGGLMGSKTQMTYCSNVVTDPSALSSPGFEEAARLVLPVLGYSEQLLQAGHGFLHGRMRHQTDSLVDEPPHGLQGPGGGLSAGLLRALQPARLLQPHPQAGQLRQLHVEVEADVQQALDLGDAGNLELLCHRGALFCILCDQT
ncbi:hypothetical protein EYF80_016471 [Liparis tanakae]|uniref:Uncharacterized protein n=1 Tax=Liparis tanakae TaxID=230148 RepID=A0A4Z2I5S3_9TELE|nr:hypothetical protein EYF80_016471 [Liparis tanakae]